MGRFILFLLPVLAAQLGHGNSEKKITYYSEGYVRFDVENTGTALKCALLTNQGEKHEYEPGWSAITERISRVSGTACSVAVVNAEAQDAGEWKITQYARKDDTGPVTAHEYEWLAVYQMSRKIVPDSSLEVYEGYYVNAELLPGMGNASLCTVQTPSGETIDLLAAPDGENPQRIGECGFRLLANASHAGRWTFTAGIGEFVVYSGKLRLIVHKEGMISDETETVYLQRGHKGTIEMGGPYTKFCQMEDPTGKKFPIGKSCSHQIPVVTAQHEGVWLAHYAVEGKLLLNTRSIRVLVSDPLTSNVRISVTENGDVHVSCYVHVFEKQEFASCRFVKPDGTIMNMSPGIGTERYSAVQVPQMTNMNDMYCDLLIRKPDETDVGAWKCGMDTRYGVFLGGRTFRIERPILKRRKYLGDGGTVIDVHIATTDVYVKEGDSFTIKCTANAALGYCWLRSPNGTAYSVSRNGKGPFTLPYEGSGISFGECGAKIEAAVYTDHGEWSCNLGVVNGVEERRTVSVTVTDSYLIAMEPRAVAQNGDERMVLSCRILPGVEDKAVRYCRWVRPDGHGIYTEESNRYYTRNTKSWCELNIQKKAGPQDYGRWKCVAGLEGFTMEEAWAEIELPGRGSTAGLLVGVAVAVCLALSATISGLVLINLHRRRRRRRLLLPEKPPAYENAVHASSPRLPAENGYGSKEFKY